MANKIASVEVTLRVDGRIVDTTLYEYDDRYPSMYKPRYPSARVAATEIYHDMNSLDNPDYIRFDDTDGLD